MKLTQEKGAFHRNVFFLALPIILQDLVNASVNLAGNFFMGRLGLYEVTAVGLANQLFFLFSLLLFGISSGSAVFMAQSWGKGAVGSIRATMGICFLAGMAAAFIFAGIALFFPEGFLMFYSSGNREVTKIGSEYLRIVGFSYFILPLTVTINVALRSIRQTKLPAFSICSALLINLVLSYIFVFRLNMGAKGIAYAVLISRVCEAAISIFMVVRLKLPVLGKLSQYLSADKAYIKRFSKTVCWVVMNEFVWALGTSLYSYIYGVNGTEGQGAAQITASFFSLFQVFGYAVGSAVAIMISNALGVSEIEAAKTYAGRFLKIVVGISAVMGLAMLIISPFFIRHYQVSDEVKADCTKLLVVMAFGMVAKTFNYTSIVSILRSGGDTMFCFLLDAGMVWLVALPLSFLGATLLRLDIVWVALFVHMEEFVKVVFAYKRVFSYKWANCLIGGEAK